MHYGKFSETEAPFWVKIKSFLYDRDIRRCKTLPFKASHGCCQFQLGQPVDNAIFYPLRPVFNFPDHFPVLIARTVNGSY